MTYQNSQIHERIEFEAWVDDIDEARPKVVQMIVDGLLDELRGAEDVAKIDERTFEDDLRALLEKQPDTIIAALGEAYELCYPYTVWCEMADDEYENGKADWKEQNG